MYEWDPHKVHFDKDGFLAEFERRAYKVMHETARAWLEETLEHIPVWSGEAKGSFIPVANALNIDLTIIPYETAPEDRTLEGEAQSDYVPPLIEKSGFTYLLLWPKGTVKHFHQNENNEASAYWAARLRHPTPWDSFKKGMTVAMRVFDNKLKGNWPDPGGYVHG